MEIVTLSFPSSISLHDQYLFNDQLQNCKPRGPSVVHGWTIKSDRRAPESSKDCAVIFKWDSLDEMYDVKQNQESLFNNGFLPLKHEASKGSKTVLYTKLRDVHMERSICVVM